MEDKMDLRIRKTYFALHNAFTELLEEKKFEDFTINELCDRAMIRRTTFYKHFADKYDYFSFYMKEVVADFQDQLDPDVRADEVNAYLLHMSRELVQFMRKHGRMVKHVLESSMFPVLLAILLEYIGEDARQVLCRADTNHKMDRGKIEDIAAFYAGGLLNTLFQQLRRNGSIDEDQFAQTMTMFLDKLEMDIAVPDRGEEMTVGN